MKINKLRQSYSCYSSPRNTQSSFHHSPQITRYRSIPKKPAIFSIQAHHKHKNNLAKYIQEEHAGIFSMEKINLDKIKSQQQFLRKAKKPAFNIKRMISQTFYSKHPSQQKNKSHPKDSNLLNFESKSIQKGKSKYDLKQFWNKYLQSEQLNRTQVQQFQLLNKNMGLVVNRSKDNKSETLAKTFYQKNNPISFNPEKAKARNRLSDVKDRTTFFVNNFIKTKYRKRSNPSSDSPRIQKVSGSPANQFRKNIREQTFQRNCIVPWQKVNDTEEDNFIA